MDQTLARVTLRDLAPDNLNALIIGVIMAKQRPRKIASTTNGTERAVWNITLRDSPYDYINVSFWGSEHYIFEIAEKFHKGDVVQLIKPRIEVRRSTSYGEQYKPMVTSAYFLTLTESYSEIKIHDQQSVDFRRLLRFPTKPIVCAIPIADIQTNGTNAQGLVDIFCVIAKVAQIREVKTRIGETAKVRDIFVFDQSRPVMKISLWDTDIIAEAEMWLPRVTVLFIADVRIQYSEYNKSVVGTLSARTIIIEEPICEEIDVLKQYAATAPLNLSAFLEQIAASIPDLSTIKTIMNIQQVYNKIHSFSSLNSDEQFTALLYPIVTKFDLDGCARTTASKCSQCNSFMNGTCTCTCWPTSNTTITSYVVFDLRLTISDHTGTLENCRLNAKAAEEMLNCSAEKFTSLSEDEKYKLKWKFLLNRCAVRILVLCKSNRRPTITILSCERADLKEVAEKIPHL